MIRRFCLVISLIASIIISIFTIREWYFFWIMPVSWIVIYWVLIGLYVLFVFLVGVLCINMKKEYESQTRLSRWFLNYTMQGIYEIAGAKIKSSGFDKIPKDKKYLLVYNHTSSFDPLAIAYKLKKERFIHVTKKENLNIPICGPFIHRNLYIPVDRNNNKEGLKSILKACNYIKNDEYSVGISPEGTRNKNPEKLLPFREGCFNIALRGKCPIVIVELYNFDKVHKRFPLKTKCEMNVLRVLDFDEIKDLSTIQISEIVFKELQDKIDTRYSK